MFSLIIPVYKVEKYLRTCVDSVIRQQYTDMEIILVDDGSPDRCPYICDEYANLYDCVKVIHKENGGLSSARNAGITVAQGRYIMFLDSDDWWNSDVSFDDLAEQVKEHNNIEMFSFSSLDYIPDDGIRVRIDASFFKESEGIHTGEKYYQELILHGNMQEAAFTKILKTDFIKNHNLFFEEGITGEDTEWMFRILRAIKNVMVLNIPLIVYRCFREGSISNSISLKNVKDALTVISQSVDYYSSNKKEGIVKSCELAQCAYLWFIVLSMYSGLTREERRAIRDEVKRYSYLAQNAKSFKVKLSRVVLQIFGLELTAKILGKYVKLRKKNIIKKGTKYNYAN